MSPRTVKIQSVGVPNMNNRVYSEQTLRSAIESCKGSVFGHLGMVAGGPELARVSHRVDNLRIEDGFLVGDVIELDTPAGRALLDMEERFGPFDFRLSGTGTCWHGRDNTVEVKNLVIASINAVVGGA